MSTIDWYALLDRPTLGIRPVRAEDAVAAVEAVLKDATIDALGVGKTLADLGATCVALGPDAVITRGAVRKGSKRPAAWWIRDGRLFLSLNVVAPPELWVEVPADRDGVANAVRALRPADDAPEKAFRFFIGLLPRFVEDFMSIENRLTIDPYCEGLPNLLGSAAPNDGRTDCFDDPLHVSQFETLLSTSRITVTALHAMLEQGSIGIGTVEYRPAPHADVVRAWNAAKKSDWPLDVPLDVLGAMDFATGASLSTIEGWISDPAQASFATIVAGVLLTAPGPAVASESEVAALLARHATNADRDVRRAVGYLCAMFGIREQLDRMIAEENDPDVREALLEMAE